jgi:hypothetical protein
MYYKNITIGIDEYIYFCSVRKLFGLSHVIFLAIKLAKSSRSSKRPGIVCRCVKADISFCNLSFIRLYLEYINN